MPGYEASDPGGEKARRRAARKVIGAYHDEQLRLLLGRVRDGLSRMDAGEITPLDVDDLIHHYTNAARALGNFCGYRGSDWERAAQTLQRLREDGEEPPDWWAAGERQSRRR